MSDQARDVLADALKLTIQDRAEVAAELLRSLDEEETRLSPDEVERRWAEEITRRARRAIHGDSVGRDADEVFGSIGAKLKPR
jgi:putative addiction module component